LLNGDSSEFATLDLRQMLRRLSGTSSVYTVGMIALRFGGLLLIPLYWRVLQPADYGVIAATSVVTNFLAVFLGLGISEAVTRFYYEWPTEERRRRVGTLWMIDWGTSLAIGLPLAVWGAPLVQLAARQVHFDPFLRLGVLTAIFASLATAPMSLLRIQERARTYILVAACWFALRTGLAIWLVVALRRGPLGVLEADALSGAIMVVPLTVLMWRAATPSLDRETMGAGLRYSLPLVPAIFVESLLFTSDRFVLEKFVSLQSLGYYAAADSLAGIVRIANSGLKTAWLPFQMRAAVERPDAPIVIGRMATYFAAATIAMAGAVALLSADVIAIIGAPAYFPVARLVPFFVVPQLVVSLVPLMTGGLGIARKTAYSSVTAALQLGSAFAALLLLVPRFGIKGAVAAMTLSSVVRLASGHALAQKWYPIRFEWHKIWVLAAGALAAVLLGRAVPVEPSLAGLGVRALVLSAYVAACGWFVLGGRRYLRTAGKTSS
jgi:O-antigen/teichoic acid export membrane protein